VQDLQVIDTQPGHSVDVPLFADFSPINPIMEEDAEGVEGKTSDQLSEGQQRQHLPAVGAIAAMPLTNQPAGLPATQEEPAVHWRQRGSEEIQLVAIGVPNVLALQFQGELAVRRGGARFAGDRHTTRTFC